MLKPPASRVARFCRAPRKEQPCKTRQFHRYRYCRPLGRLCGNSPCLFPRLNFLANRKNRLRDCILLHIGLTAPTRAPTGLWQATSRHPRSGFLRFLPHENFVFPDRTHIHIPKKHPHKPCRLPPRLQRYNPPPVLFLCKTCFSLPWPVLWLSAPTQSRPEPV